MHHGAVQSGVHASCSQQTAEPVSKPEQEKKDLVWWWLLSRAPLAASNRTLCRNRMDSYSKFGLHVEADNATHPRRYKKFYSSYEDLSA